MADEAQSLPLSADNLESIPAEFRNLYHQVDGKHVINAGLGNNIAAEMEAQRKIREFRETNISLTKANEEAQKKLEGFNKLGMTAEQALEMRQHMQDLREKGFKHEGDIEKFVTSRTEAMKKEYDKKSQENAEQIRMLTESSERYRNLYHQGELRNLVIEKASTASPLKATALPDLLNRASSTWKLDHESGDMYAVGEDGNRRMGKDGIKPMSMEEYLEELAEQAPHLFEQGSAGGVTQPNAGGMLQGTPGSVPWVDHRDPIAMGQYAEKIASGEMDVR